MSTIKNGSKVRFHYTLTVDGHVVDSSVGGDPFRFVQGSHGIVPGLETELEGLEVGDTKDIVIQPEQGYGHMNPDAVQKVPRSAFSDASKLTPGDFVRGQSEQGQIQARVDAVDDEHVTLDLNHPLAGKTLEFRIEIVEVR